MKSLYFRFFMVILFWCAPHLSAQSSRTFDGGVTVTPFPFTQNDSILISVDVTQTYPRSPNSLSLFGSTELWIHGGVNTGTAGNSATQWQKLIGVWRVYPTRCRFTRRTDNPNIFDLRLRPVNFWQLQAGEAISELCCVFNNGPNGTTEGGGPPIVPEQGKSDIFIPVAASSLGGATCSGTTILTSASGSFSDGATSGTNYSNNLDCRWLIQPAGGATSITLNFTRFSTESCCDYVEIYPGTSVAGAPLYRLSGTSLPSSITVNGSAVVVRFTTDGSVASSGWSLNYTSGTGSITLQSSGILLTESLQANSTVRRNNRTGTTSAVLYRSLSSSSGGVAYDPQMRRVYWCASGQGVIYSSDMIGQNLQAIVTNLGQPTGIAIDNVNRKIYWTEFGTGIIGRSNMDGSGKELVMQAAPPADNITSKTLESETTALQKESSFDPRIASAEQMLPSDKSSDKGRSAQLHLISSLNRPWGIDVDPAGGKIYWTEQSGNTIKRANLNGTSIETLISAGLSAPRGIRVVPSEGRIYFVDSFNKSIKRASLTGANPTTIFTDSSSANPLDIAVDIANSRIYWTDNIRDNISVMNTDGTNRTVIYSNPAADNDGCFGLTLFDNAETTSPSSSLTISGRVTTTNSAGSSVGVANVDVRIGNATYTTDAQGFYMARNLSVGGYSITPQGTGAYLGFSPTTRSVALNDAGWVAQDFQALLSCSGTTTFTSTSGTFSDRTTSLSATNYSNNLDCRWLIAPSVEVSSITIAFSRFATESCCDYVEIYAGASVSGTPAYRFSGTSLPPSVRVNAANAVVRFITDGSGTDIGWSLSYTSVPIPPSCSGTTTFTSASGTFSDRTNGASAYSNNVDCRWVIMPSGGASSITLTFSQFSTESCCDYVEIYSGTGTSGTPIQRFSGSTLPQALTVNSGTVTVRFITDGSVTSSGWTLTYTSNAQTPAGSVSVQAPTQTAQSGSAFTLPITVSSLTGLGILSYRLVLTYDPALITISGVQQSNTLSANATVTTNTSVRGQITVSVFSTTALSGMGTLINFTGTVTGTTGQSALTLSSVQFNEGMPQAVATSGVLRITSPILCGDVSQNGVVTAFDAALVAQHDAGVARLTGNALQAGDVSGNGQVTAFDAALIAQFDARLITSFPSGACSMMVNGLALEKPLSSRIVHADVAVSLPVLNDIRTGTGQTQFVIPMTIGSVGGESILAYSFRLTYNPSILRISGGTIDKTLSENGTLTVNTMTDGEIRASYFRTQPLVGAAPNILLNLNATLLANGSSPLTLQQFTFNEGSPKAAITNGGINTGVTSAKNETGSFNALFIAPNPTSTETILSYTLDTSSFVQVELFSLLGEKILTVANEYQAANTYRYTLNLNAIASGVYIVRLQANNTMLHRQISVVR